MRRVLAAILALAILTTSCAEVRYVDTTDEATPLEDVSEELSGKNATVLMRDGRSMDVRRVVIRPDSTALVPRDPAAPGMVVPTHRIARFRVTNRLRGTLMGGLAGLVGGFLLGAAIGSASYSEDDSGFLVSSSADAAIFAGVYLGVLGFGAGALVGAVGGSEQTYEIWAPHSTDGPEDKAGDLR